jgi:hypothetical protein
MYQKIFNADKSNPFVIHRTEITSNGEEITVDIKVGTRIRINVSSIDTDSDEVYATFTYNNRITTTEILIGSLSLNKRRLEGARILQKGVDNQSYWIELASLDEELHVKGNLFILESYCFNCGNNDIISTAIAKWNWKTGWLVYMHNSMKNVSMLVQEEEIVLAPKDTWLPPNVVFSIFILIVLTLTLVPRYIVIRRKQKRFDNKEN